MWLFRYYSAKSSVTKFDVIVILFAFESHYYFIIWINFVIIIDPNPINMENIITEKSIAICDDLFSFSFNSNAGELSAVTTILFRSVPFGISNVKLHGNWVDILSICNSNRQVSLLTMLNPLGQS